MATERLLERLNRLWSAALQLAWFRVTLVVATGAYLSLSYRVVNALTVPRYDFALRIDDFIPFLPWTGLIYWSYFFLFVAAAVVIAPHRLGRLWVGVLTANLTAYGCYVLWTAHVPHPSVAHVEPAWLRAAWQWFYTQDGPGNTLPSLHCALSALLGWNLRHRHRGWLLWAVAIAVSTLTTKEHVFLDLVAGWALAAMIQRAIVRPELADKAHAVQPALATDDRIAGTATD